LFKDYNIKKESKIDLMIRGKLSKLKRDIDNSKTFEKKKKLIE